MQKHLPATILDSKMGGGDPPTHSSEGYNTPMRTFFGQAHYAFLAIWVMLFDRKSLNTKTAPSVILPLRAFGMNQYLNAHMHSTHQYVLHRLS